MSNVVELNRADDPRDVIHEAVQLLAEGNLVGLPTDTVYVPAAHALHAEAVARLQRVCEEFGLRPGVLAIKSASEAEDYVPDMEEQGRKLSRRCWPGPVTLTFERTDPAGLTAALPEPAQKLLLSSGGIALRVPAHDVVSSVLRLTPAPLILGWEVNEAGEYSKTAAEVASRWGAHMAQVIDDGPCRYGHPSSVVRFAGSHSHLDREGVVTQRMLARLAGDVFLFVCTGNTCRSPMAEGIFRKLLSDRLKCAEEDLVDQGFVVASAGLAAAMGSPPSPESVQILRDRGIDLEGHASQPLTPRLLNQADHIFTMTRQHREAIVREFPELTHRVTLLSRGGTDISDPIGYGLEEYEKCADEIERHLREILAEMPAT